MRIEANGLMPLAGFLCAPVEHPTFDGWAKALMLPREQPQSRFFLKISDEAAHRGLACVNCRGALVTDPS